MKLSPPKKTTFWAAVVLAVVGLVFYFIAALTPFSFWILLVAFVVLVLGNFMQGF